MESPGEKLCMNQRQELQKLVSGQLLDTDISLGSWASVPGPPPEAEETQRNTCSKTHTVFQVRSGALWRR